MRLNVRQTLPRAHRVYSEVTGLAWGVHLGVCTQTRCTPVEFRRHVVCDCTLWHHHHGHGLLEMMLPTEDRVDAAVILSHHHVHTPGTCCVPVVFEPWVHTQISRPAAEKQKKQHKVLCQRRFEGLNIRGAQRLVYSHLRIYSNNFWVLYLT